MSILHGLLVGFLFPLMGWFFIRESLPNFFDAEAEAQAELAGSGYAGAGSGGAQGEIGRDGPVGRGNSTGGASLRQGEQNRGQDRREDQSNERLQTASNSNLNPNINVNANANANDELGRQVSARVAANFAVGGMTVPTLIFGKRMQVSRVVILFIFCNREKKEGYLYRTVSCRWACCSGLYSTLLLGR